MQGKEISYSQLRKDFYSKYKKIIVPLVQQQESSRKRHLLLAIVLTGIFVVLALLLFMHAKLENNFSSSDFKAISTLIFFSFVPWSIIKKIFEGKIKMQIMPTVCSCFGDMQWGEIVYMGDDSLFYRSGIIPKFTSRDYDDIFTGSFKDVKFEILEAEYHIGSGKNRRTLFKGVLVKLNMNKPFKSHTLIKPNSMFDNSPVSKLRHTQLEDIQFNKKFDVFTNDEIGARVLITPIFMERLKNMKVSFFAENVSCAFYEENLIIALKTNKDLFSLCSLVKPIDDRKQYMQMYEEILSIIKLIDYFKLDKK